MFACTAALPHHRFFGSLLPLRSEFIWDGCRDYAPLLAISAALRAVQQLGPGAVQSYQRQLLAAAVDCLVAAWGTGVRKLAHVEHLMLPIMDGAPCKMRDVPSQILLIPPLACAPQARWFHCPCAAPWRLWSCREAAWLLPRGLALVAPHPHQQQQQQRTAAVPPRQQIPSGCRTRCTTGTGLSAPSSV